MIIWLCLVSLGVAQFCEKDTECPLKYASFPEDTHGRIRPDVLFTSNREEILDSELILRSGEIPGWLDGTLYRVGPGLYEHGNRNVTNVVDALSKVSRWSFKTMDGKSMRGTFSTFFLRSSIYNRTMAEGNLVRMRHLGQMHPPLTPLEIAQVLLYDSEPDNNNIAVWQLGSSGLTVTAESVTYIDIDYESLAYRRKHVPVSDDAHWATKEALSASHFTRHPGSGDSINYKLVIPMDKGMISGTVTPEYRLYRYQPTTAPGDVVTAQLIGKFPIAKDGFRVVHSLGATPNYVILPRFSLVVRLNHPVDSSQNIMLDPTAPTYFDVIGMADGSHTSFTFPAYESQHILNTFERRNAKGQLEIVVDYPTIEDINQAFKGECIFELLDIRRLKDPHFNFHDHWQSYMEFRFRRFILNMDTGEGSVYEFPQMWRPRVLQVEFPYINDAFRGLPYCFVYAHTWNHAAHHAMGLIKVDLCTETSIGWHEPNKFPAEPVFVEAPTATSEDDGVVVSPVYDAVENTSFVYIWSAKDLKVLAVLQSEVNVPLTLHGIWVNGV